MNFSTSILEGDFIWGVFVSFFCLSVCFMVVQLFCGFVVCRFCFGLMWDAFSFVRCPVIVSL